MIGVPRSAPEPIEPLAEREARLVVAFRRKLEHLFHNYRATVAHRDRTLTFNESLATARQALNPRAKRKPSRRRVDPEFELLLNIKALELAKQHDPTATSPGPNDVRLAAECLVAQLKPRRGRPPDRLLTYHVHALMALHFQTSGKHLEASVTQDSIYAPRLTSSMGEVVLSLFQDVDPDVTMTRLADIVLAAHRSGVIEGKTFEDFFPLFGGSIDTATGQPSAGPGYRIERFERVAPIYSS